MKKFWMILLAAVLVFGLVVGCGGNSRECDVCGKYPCECEGDKNIPDLVLEAADIDVMIIGSGSGSADSTVQGNKFIMKWTGSGDATGVGFGVEFPADADPYTYVKLEAKITAIDGSSAAAFTVKASTQMDDLRGFGANSSPQYSRNAELNIGDSVGDEAAASEYASDDFVTDLFRKNLFTGGIWFQFNPWNEFWDPDFPAIHAKLKGAQDFTVEVTKVTFTNKGTASPDIELTAAHFTAGNLKQFLSDGPVTPVTVTPNGGIEVGTITIFYDGSTTLPTGVGEYVITINVAGATGYKPATGLVVGTLIVEADAPAFLYRLDMNAILPAGADGDEIPIAALGPVLTKRGLDAAGSITLAITEGVRGIRVAINNQGWDAIVINGSAIAGGFQEGDVLTLTGRLESTVNGGNTEIMMNIGDWGPVGGNAAVNVGDTFTRTGALTAANITSLEGTGGGVIRIRLNNMPTAAAGEYNVFIIESLIIERPTAGFELGDFTVVNSDNQKGWATNGVDEVETDLTAEILTTAKFLVLELSAPPAGGMQIIWQGNGNSWGWDQNDILTGTGGMMPEAGTSIEGNVLTIELSKAFVNYDAFVTSTQVKFFIAYYTGGIAGLGVEKAYLTY